MLSHVLTFGKKQSLVVLYKMCNRCSEFERKQGKD